MEVRETRFGFAYGPAEITRCASDDKAGWASFDITTKKGVVHVLCLKGGKMHVRQFDNKTNKWADLYAAQSITSKEE